MADRVVRSIALNPFISVFSDAFLLEVANPTAIATNNKLLAMAVHNAPTTKHRFHPYIVVLFLDVLDIVLQVFESIFVFPG